MDTASKGEETISFERDVWKSTDGWHIERPLDRNWLASIKARVP